MTRVSRFILVRHGESEGNRDRLFTHTPDVPLTGTGREQARAAAALIAGRYQPTRLVASPFLRAWQTAEVLAEVLQLTVETDPAFREQSFGRLAGEPYEALLVDPTYHSTPRWEWRPPGGESLLDVLARVSPAFEQLAQAGDGRDIVLVSHGGVMLALWAYLAGGWEDARMTPNGGIVVVEHHNGTFRPPCSIS